jgi:hypothetical protein
MHSFIIKCYQFLEQTVTKTAQTETKVTDCEVVKYMMAEQTVFH